MTHVPYEQTVEQKHNGSHMVTLCNVLSDAHLNSVALTSLTSSTLPDPADAYESSFIQTLSR